MRISGNSPLDPVAGVAAARPGHRPEPAAGTGKGDSFEISGRAREIEMAREAIQKLPQVREERVAFLREEIRTGRYDVPAEAIAASMLAAVARG